MDHNDPYRASGAPLAPAVQKLDLESAGKGRRFLNYLIDSVVYLAILFVLGMLSYVVWGESTVYWREANAGLEALINLAIITAYYALMEGLFGCTVGKLLTNTRVVDEYGRPPGLARALGRSVARLIPFEAFSVLFTEEGRGWHDSLARTYVVRRPRPGQPVGTPRPSISDAFANGTQGRIEPVFEKPAP